MKVLLIAPVIFPCGGDLRYAGIERIVTYWSSCLAGLGYKVTVASAKGSLFPKGIQYIEVPRGDFTTGELIAYEQYKGRLKDFDIILDFSHSHWAMRIHTLPAMCWCWHDPYQIQPPLPSYNVLALSQWQANRLFAYQKVKARVFDCHCGYPVPLQEHDGSYIFIGRATPTKGMLEAAQICQRMQVPLNIIGGLGPNDDPRYLQSVLTLCENQIKYIGEANDEAKNYLLVRAKALIYPIRYPPESGEAHSHKSVDSLLCGTQVVAFCQGALPEVIEHGEDGFLAFTEPEFQFFMRQELNREKIQRRAIERWAVDNVVRRAVPLIEEVAGGLRW